MKRLYFLILMLATCQVAVGQQAVQATIPAAKDVAVKTDGKAFTGLEHAVPAIPFNRDNRDNEPIVGQARGATFWMEIIGNSIYDLQSNGSIDNRFVQVDGKMAAGWTQSLENDPFNDRGTGYNYHDGEVWDNIPLERIEDVRVGWPTIMITESGREISIAHGGLGSQLIISYKDEGDSDWTQGEIPTNSGQWILWPRAVCVGNTIHLIAITAPVANGGFEYEGQDGALMYWRSPDGGETWDVVDYIDESHNSDNYSAFGGDAYAIFARGDKVAYASFNDWADSFIMVSEDNGETWTQTALVDFPVDNFAQDEEILDLDEDGLADTILNSDNAGAVFIDADGTPHAMWGNMRYLDETIGDGNWSYFPFTDGLQYWREDFGPDSSQTIAFAEDTDDDGILTLEDEIGTYFTSLTGFPQMGQDGDGNLYACYSGVMESHSSGAQNYRHLYIMKSEDGGDNWGEPVDGTPDTDIFFFEYVFASMAPEIDDYVNIILQRDFEPGLHVRGDLDAPDLNDIVHYTITKDLANDEGIGVDEILDPFANLSIYPVPAQEEFYVHLEGSKGLNIEVYDITGKLVRSQYEVNELTVFNVAELPAGVYMVKMEHDGSEITQRLVKR